MLAGNPAKPEYGLNTDRYTKYTYLKRKIKTQCIFSCRERYLHDEDVKDEKDVPSMFLTFTFPLIFFISELLCKRV